MSYIRKETVGSFTEAELLQIVKKNLDELGIAYEEKPGGFGDAFLLNPNVFETIDCTESVTITTSTSYRRYRPQAPIVCDLDVCGSKLRFASIWDEDGQGSSAA